MGTENQEKRETGRAGDRSNKSLSVRLLPWALGAFAIYTFATNSIVHGWMGLPVAQIIHITIGLAVAEAVFFVGGLLLPLRRVFFPPSDITVLDEDLIAGVDSIMASENPTPLQCWCAGSVLVDEIARQLSKVRALPLLKPVFMMDSGQLHHIELVGLTDDGLLMLGGDEHWIKSFNRKDDKTMYDMQTLNSLKNLLQTVFDDERRLHVHPDFQECLKKRMSKSV